MLNRQFYFRMSLTLVLGFAGIRDLPAASPDFNRDVRPILSQFCFKCHGPDDATREGGIRLDQAASASRQGDSGEITIDPFHPERSELIRRILSDDDSEQMPPPATHLKLTSAQKQILSDWIKAGAVYEQHWAFVPPAEVRPPVVANADWPINPIDCFVLAALERQGQKPSRPAGRHEILRRVYLDLIGVPPNSSQMEEFIQDLRPGAYERLVDRLLASPQYGERWARRWLDLARYADTNGYEKDRPRSVWPYRDWVIRALNADLPFDQFSLEQLAGDMLPNATLDQQVATGFHRQTMLNEEGGIDPQEFRFYSLTDRVATTGTVWLGLTVGCAQCHTHKYDPLTHTEYYQFLAILNNAHELEQELPAPVIARQREMLEREIAEREAELPRRFPARDPWRWLTPHAVEAVSAQGATLSLGKGEIIQASGTTPATDTYTIVLETDAKEVSAIQIEALMDESSDQKGPGRTPHGNFVITNLKVERLLENGEAEPIAIQSASADFSQDHFPAEHAIDDHPHTGWAIQGTGNWNVTRHLTARLSRRIRTMGASRWRVHIEQYFGDRHTLGRFRIHFASLADNRPLRIRSKEHLQQRFDVWQTQNRQAAVHWNVVRPIEWSTTSPRLSLLDDGSLLATGDLTKRDVFDLEFDTALDAATAVRIETLPDARLPRNGPGMVYYEGPRGDFFLSELELLSNGKPQSFSHADQTYANGKHTAAAAIDQNPLTGWSIDGGQGRPHVALFRLAQPLPPAGRHRLRLIFERYYAAALGRFRISITRDQVLPDAMALPVAIEAILLIPQEKRSPEQKQQLLKTFCLGAPELQRERSEIDQLRRSLPERPTTLIFEERPTDFPRETRRRHRGEFLQPKEVVTAGVPAFLPQPNNSSPWNRLELANWLFQGNHPLTARVTVNRHWQSFFGKGLVTTVDDFGYQGSLPSHPALLDWLAREFIARGWSQKDLHRLIVTSATYRQRSMTTPKQKAFDPENRWLGRGPRIRLSAEQIRDSLLSVSGLLSDKQLGPSVFPPQPESVTTEGTYGKLEWTVSPGEDRYRRGLYTFSKRTAPYAMFATFDAPSGEACIARRDVSNTALQALTLLNDPVVMEAARNLGREVSNKSGTIPDLVSQLFARTLTRQPSPEEIATIANYWNQQHSRLASGQLSASMVNGQEHLTDAKQAAWTMTARLLFNLDEFVTKP